MGMNFRVQLLPVAEEEPPWKGHVLAEWRKAFDLLVWLSDNREPWPEGRWPEGWTDQQEDFLVSAEAMRDYAARCQEPHEGWCYTDDPAGAIMAAVDAGFDEFYVWVSY